MDLVSRGVLESRRAACAVGSPSGAGTIVPTSPSAICSNTRRASPRGWSMRRRAGAVNSNTRSARCRSSTRRGRGRSTATSDSSCWVSWRQIAAGRRSTRSSRALVTISTGLTFACQPAIGERAAPTMALPEDIRRGRVLRAKSTTTTRRRLAVWRDMPGSVRHRRCRRRVWARRAARGAWRRLGRRAADAGAGPTLHDAEHGAGQFSRARAGTRCADVVVRHAHVAVGVRPRRLHRHVALDRSGPRQVFRAADEPRVFGRVTRRDAGCSPRVSRRACRTVKPSGSPNHPITR